jgi:hypothetical protein
LKNLTWFDPLKILLRQLFLCKLDHFSALGKKVDYYETVWLAKRASKFTLKISQNPRIDEIIFDKFVHNSLVTWTREHLLKGKAQYG